MKVRSGFVSNSSSSSFIVAGKDLDTLKNGKLELDVDFTKYGTIIETKKDAEEYFIYEYGSRSDTIETLCENNKWIRDRYEMMIAEIEKGKVVCVGRCSSESFDDPTELHLYEFGVGGVKGNISVMYNER